MASVNQLIRKGLLNGIQPLVNNNSFLYDGVDEKINYPTNSAFDFEYTDPFSFSCWINFPALASSAATMGRYNVTGTPKGWYLIKGADDFLTFAIRYGGGQIISLRLDKVVIGWGINEWFNIVGTYDGSNDLSGMNFYYNSSNADQINEFNLPMSTSIKSSSPFVLGAQGDNINYGNVRINNTAIFDKELSQAEVTEIYSGGKPKDLTEHSASANLVLYHRPETCTWNGSAFDCPDESGTTTDGLSVNMEEADKITDTP